jgi:hypothetical protein
MSEFFIIAAFNDHACGEAYYQDCQVATDISTALSIAIKYAESHDHVCIIPNEYNAVLYTTDEYSKILPYAIEIFVGDKVNVNKLLTLLKTP